MWKISRYVLYLFFANSPRYPICILQILREVGIVAYKRAVALTTGPDFAWYRHLEDEIQKNYIGPDSYWKRSEDGSNPACKSYFGNTWWIPFPPTLVRIR